MFNDKSGNKNYKYMIRRIFFGLFLLFAVNSFSQTSDIQVVRTEKIIGKNVVTNSVIKGVEYYFPKCIHNAYVDTTSGLFSVQLCKLSRSKGLLKNKGELVVCNLSDGKVRWEKKVFYHTSRLQQCNNNIIHTIDHTSYCLSANSGEKLWELKNSISYADPICKVGVGYKNKDFIGYPNIIQGIDLADGTVLWERKIKKEYGWNEILNINDSVRMFVAAGLHTVNLKNGRGWDYKAVTGEENYTADKDIASGVAGVVASSNVGTGSNTAVGVVSNIIIDNLDIYIASKDKISRINKRNGNVIWSCPLQTDLTSKSSIFVEKDLIYIVNYGYAFMQCRQIDYGIPFIAAYEKNTGKQIYFSEVNLKEQPILGFQNIDDKLMLLFSDKVAEYSLETGVKLSEKEIDTYRYGKLKNFVGDHVYIANDNDSYVSLPLSDKTMSYISTTKGEILVLDSKFNIVDKINYGKLSICYLKTDKLTFIVKGNKTIIINLEGKRVAELFLTSNTILKGDKLYDIQNQGFLKVDLSDVI